MNKILLSILLVLAMLPEVLRAQISEGGLPLSYTENNLKSAQAIPVFELQPLPIDALVAENDNNGTPYRYSEITSTVLDLKSGLNTKLETGDIWRYTIASENAKSIKIIFSKFDIPQGAKLFLYNKNYADIYGAFTAQNGSGIFSVADFPGNELTLEYYEPANAAFNGTLIIEQIGQAFIELDALLAESNINYVDVNCAEGINWQLEKHAVCKYTFTEDNSGYLCTGALINNSANDGTPFFLTANHCVSSVSSAESVVAYFNYETKGCGLAQKTPKTLSGATLLTTGSESDFTLLKLTMSPTSKHQAYYAGWDLTDTASSCVGIHHPEGIIKKISVDDDPPNTFNDKINWDGGVVTPAGTHWQVAFDLGVTAGGSSGSPLFNEKGRIIGQLHGGGDAEDYYGKINYSWDHKPRFYETLKSFLTNNTDQYIEGYYPDTNIPEAVFSTDYQYVCVGSPIPLKSYSVFDITDLEWQFTPSTVTFTDNTTANSANPMVSFDQAGSYDVKLVVRNNNGRDSMTYRELITAGDIIAISYTLDTDQGICYSNFDSVTISAKGAPLFDWELDSLSSVYFNISPINATQAIVKKNPDITIESTMSISGTLTGIQDNCTDQSSFALEVIYQPNDDIANATLVDFGESGPYTNSCATIEENEPYPPVGKTSCISQSKWCDEYGDGENVIENSLWFYFETPTNRKINIEATGMDGQIALYSADSYEDLLNGSYFLVAANDDISTADFNSRIDNVDVLTANKYWIQFDGSAGGTEGTFMLTITTPTAIESQAVAINTPLTLYPQPAFDYVIAESSLLKGLSNVRVNLYNSKGELVYTDETDVTQNYVKVDFAGYQFPQGLYFISLSDGNKTVSQRLIITENAR